jgi:hypothetical protein
MEPAENRLDDADVTLQAYAEEWRRQWGQPGTGWMTAREI